MPTLHIATDAQDIAALRTFIEQAAQSLGIAAESMYTLMLVVEELGLNIAAYGYGGRPGPVELTLEDSGDAVVLRLRDQAPPFDPTQLPPPDITLPLELRDAGGLGVHLVRRLMDDMQYRALPGGGNELTLTKRGIVRMIERG